MEAILGAELWSEVLEWSQILEWQQFLLHLYIKLAPCFL